MEIGRWTKYEKMDKQIQFTRTECGILSAALVESAKQTQLFRIASVELEKTKTIYQ